MWNGFIPAAGNAMIDELPPYYRALFDALAGQSADDTLMLPWPVWREAFINDASEAVARAAYDGLSSEPYQPFKDKLDLARFYQTQIPKASSTAPRTQHCRQDPNGAGIRACRPGWACTAWYRCRAATRSCSPTPPG